MAWLITKDHINSTDECVEGRYRGPERKPDMPIKWRILDGDQELYYEGVCDKEAVDNDMGSAGVYHLYYWAMHDVGSTELELWDEETQKWESLYC